MSSTSVLSTRQKIVSSIIVLFFTLIVFNIHNSFPEVVLFLCGFSIGAILTKEFLLGYNTDEALDSGQQEEPESGSASADENAKQTSIWSQVSKYLYIGSIVLILLTGGVVLFGGGIPFVGSGSSTVSGTVYADGGPAANQIVELTSESSNIQLSTTTNSNGKFEFDTSGFNGPYILSIEGYNSRQVVDGDTNIKFGEPPGLLSSLPFIGSGSSGDQEATTTGDSGDISNSGSRTDGGEQVFRVLNGTVVDRNGDPVSFATVTIEYGNGSQLTQEQETGQDGRYRYEDVPYEGDIQNITLVWKASEEGYQDGLTSLDLGQFLENEEEGIERNIGLTQEDIDGE